MQKANTQLKTPHLIQRGTSLDFDKTKRTGEYIGLDYMGAAEFEFGAFPQFQRNVWANIQNYVVETYYKGEECFYFFLPKNSWHDYVEFVPGLLNGTTHLKCSAGFDRKKVLYVGKDKTALFDQPHAPFEFDVWFDLTNNVIISRQLYVIEYLAQYCIPNSIQYMDEQANLKVKEGRR